jgi:hypothetical protein
LRLQRVSKKISIMVLQSIPCWRGYLIRVLFMLLFNNLTVDVVSSDIL